MEERERERERVRDAGETMHKHMAVEGMHAAEAEAPGKRDGCRTPAQHLPPSLQQHSPPLHLI